ncbi:hypothetical protein ACWDZ4_33285 [Streptomyces sp. NPDC003016]
MYTRLITVVGPAVLVRALVHITRLALRDQRAKRFDAAAHGLVPRARLDPRHPGPPRDEPAPRLAVDASCPGYVTRSPPRW